MKFFLLLFVFATAARGKAPKASPPGNSKADLAELKAELKAELTAELKAELMERRARLEKVFLAKLLKKAKRQKIELNGLNVVELKQALDKRSKARTALRASDARQDITLDTLDAYLLQLDNRISNLENSTDDAVAGLESATDRIDKLQSSIDKLELAYCKMRPESQLIKTVYAGTPNATSEWTSAGSTPHTADNAFKPQSNDNDAPWASTSLPATVWYNFNTKFTLAKISFTSRAGTNWAQAPKTFEVVGSSSNTCSNWHVLKSVTNAGFTAEKQTKAWKIPCEKQKSFKCYGIRATRDTDGNNNLVALVNIVMYH